MPQIAHSNWLLQVGHNVFAATFNCGMVGVVTPVIHCLLYGEVYPSGHLAETFPYRLEDNPSYLHFPGDGKNVDYAEGIYVGYRYYEKKKVPVRWAFGHGLSYTTFAYSNIRTDKNEMDDNGTIKVSVDVTNTGKVAGKEMIVQLNGMLGA